ncbi:hypothetical protein [Candidatus Scalindua japonica]|uniref:hypothetical protein n=1 Tax=Candidatus Scalindua japonica TaxID=1284222 RepID=UPI000BDECA59|nr:hypothetical protein [Candidatus Scalindua japonica]
MDIEKTWEKALKYTEIIRPRVKPLDTHQTTHLPYIFLAESSVNLGDCVVRKGEVLVEKPTLLLPPGSPQLDGFDFRDAYQQQQDMITNFFLVRGIEFPSLKYNNKTYSLDIFEDRLSKAIEQYTQDLQKEENVTSGLVIGPEDCWQFSVLIFICTQIVRSADNDIKSFRNRWNR